MALALTTFWEAFFLFMIWVPLVVLWFSSLMDVFRRSDLGGFSKAMWALCILCLPYFGVLVYLVARPRLAPA